MDEIRISVVMATFDGAAYVTAQLDSLCAALGPEDEIVVSDDGSRDATRAIVAAYPDARVRLLPPGPRLGYQGNFARAIAASRGRIIVFSDQDDICLPARIPRSLAALETAACVCGDATVVDADLNTLQPSFFAARGARFGAGRLFVRPAVIGATMAARRDFVLASLPFPAHVPHDMWLSIRAARRGQLAVIDTPVILYRRHGTAVSVTASGRRRSLGTILTERLRLARALLTRPG